MTKGGKTENEDREAWWMKAGSDCDTVGYCKEVNGSLEQS